MDLPSLLSPYLIVRCFFLRLDTYRVPKYPLHWRCAAAYGRGCEFAKSGGLRFFAFFVVFYTLLFFSCRDESARHESDVWMIVEIDAERAVDSR